MLPISDILKAFAKTLEDNAPAVLTGLSVAGSVGTAILAGRASFQAYEAIEREETKYATGRQDLPLKGRIALVWPLFVPAGISLALTTTCIIGSNRISSKRATALATAFTLTERAFDEYKDKVVETIGENKATKVRDAIAQDRIDAQPPVSSQVILTGKGEVLCYESWSGRYFKSSADAIHRAENDINRKINLDMYASMNEFTDLLGMLPNGEGEHIGWNLDKPLMVQISGGLSEDQEPILVVGYRHTPFSAYHKLV